MLEKKLGVGFHSIIFEKVEAELEGNEKRRSGRRRTKHDGEPWKFSRFALRFNVNRSLTEP